MRRQLNICMVSDFFYPNMGGVENHLFCLSQCLMELGHKVIIVTHAYNDRNGVRWLSKGLKVYYLPVLVMHSQCTLPTLCGNMLLMRDIFIREQVDVVHGHQAFSSLAHEAMFHANAMELATIYTDHSLFGFSDTSSILTNKLMIGTFANVQAVICVSHTSKENTALRASISPSQVYVIPNAVVPEHFNPDPDHKSDPDHITIVVASRLVYRKGIDLLISIIPKLCNAHPGLKFVIAGDGPKRVDLEQTREKHFLMDRVELVGAVASHQVCQVLVRGKIFLNTSLTEAFCMAIIEAASCGLLVVSTRVGGIPEVLPEDMIILSQPDELDLYSAVERAMEIIRNGSVDTSKFHQRVSRMYSWAQVAQRTEAVYFKVLSRPKLTFIERLENFYQCGFVFGKVLCILAALEHLILMALDRIMPSSQIPPSPIFDKKSYGKLVDDASPLLHDY